MSAGKLDLIIEQGATFTYILLWKDALDAPIDITNYTARMQVRPKKTSDTLYLELTSTAGDIVIVGVEGKLTLNIPVAVTDTITWLKAVYDLELVSPAGVVTRLVEGIVDVSFNTTRIVATTALPSYISDTHWAGTDIVFNSTSNEWEKTNAGISTLTEANDWIINFRPVSMIINYIVTAENGTGTVFDIQTLAGDSLGSVTINSVLNSPTFVTIPLTFASSDIYKLVIGTSGFQDDLTIDNITFILP